MKSIKNIILIDGEELYFIDRTIEKIINRYIDEEFEQFNLDRFHTVSFADIYNACETLPFMSEKKLVIVEDIDLSKSSQSSIKNDLEQFINYFPNIPETTILVFVFRGKKSFRSKFVKAIDKIGEHQSYDKLTMAALREFIIQHLAKYHFQPEFLDLFIDRSRYLDKNHNKNLYDILNELDKLKNNTNHFVLQTGDLDRLAGNYEKNIFKLMDSFSQKDLSSSIQYLHDLNRERDDSYRIFFMLVRQIRNLLYTKELIRRKYPMESALKVSGISKFEFQKLARFIRNWSYKDLKTAIHLSYEFEVWMKTAATDSKKMLENFLIQNLLNH